MFVIYAAQFSLLFLSYQLFVSSKTLNYYDICRNNSGQRIYLEFGEKYSLEASNLTNNGVIKQKCSLEIVTCPSCIIFANFSYFNLSNECNETKSVNGNCPCEYIQTFEHPYDESSLKRFCTINESMKTLTRNLVVQLYYLFSNNLAFIAEYKSIRNRISLTEDKMKRNIYLTSPFFPSFYSNDLASEYIISCPKREKENCQVRLIFTDFQLAIESIMEFFDWNGQRLNVVTGIHFRPPILLSTGPSLVVRFYANGGTGLFKAIYMFDTTYENRTGYNTDCGGFVDNLGGGITMMNMVEIGVKQFYCFWIIKPPKNYFHFKTYLYLKVENFTNMGNETEIVIHKTATSAGKILEIIRHLNNVYPIIPKEHVQAIETGFYISLKGTFGVKSRLAIAYAAFSYKECFSGADFLCENHRCIPQQLMCDGFDHCGDNSDEPISCLKDTSLEPIDRRWYSRTPNYFFPKIDPYSDLKTATLIFIMSSLGLISLVSTFFVLLYKINHRARHERELQNHLQIITDLLEEEILDSDSIPDEPPVYEAPPNYDEIVKVNFDSTVSGKRKSTKPKRKRRNRSVKSHRLDKNESNCSELVHQSFNTNLNLITECNVNLEEKFKNTKYEDVKHKRHFIKNNPFFYFSDKAISSNVKFILKRKWHSHGELDIKKDVEISIKKEKSTKNSSYSPIFTRNSYTFFSRETASDSELLNIDSDEEQYKNNLNSSCASETIVQFEKGLFDYFKKRSICQCEGACGCASVQNSSKKFSKKIRKNVMKKKHSKFSTRLVKSTTFHSMIPNINLLLREIIRCIITSFSMVRS